MAKGACVEKLSHTCGSRKGLQVFLQEDGSYDGHCFSCNTPVPNPYKDKPAGYKPTAFVKSAEEIQEEIADILTYPTVDLPDRMLRLESLEYFDIKMGLSETDGETVVTHHYPYTKLNSVTGYKIRLVADKRMWSVGDLKEVDLFGWEQAVKTGARKLFITEGELDAVALYQLLRDQASAQWRHLHPAVVSLPHGAASAGRDLSRLISKIRKTFKEVVLAFDMDEPGERAVEDATKVIPEAFRAQLPCKDANAAIIEGRMKACFNAVMFNASKPKNTRIVRGSSLKDLAKKRPEWGLSWPWETLTDLTRGIRRGETYYFGAGVKMGKSELVNALAAHLMVEHGKTVLLCKPEEATAKSYQMLVGKVAGRIFHDPKIEFDEVAFDEAEPLVGDKALILDSYQFVDWETLKVDIAYAVKNEGVEDVILDPITCFTNHMSASEANEFLALMASELSAMAKDLGFTAYVFCHLKAPGQGDSHERGGQVLSTQFAGSRAMMRSCNYMIGMEGNKSPDLPIEARNMRKLVLLEDREFGNTGYVNLRWELGTGKFTEIKA